MNIRYSTLEQYVDVLTYLMDDLVTLPQILYELKFSSNTLQRYLAVLKSQGLIEPYFLENDRKNPKYKITEKGRAVLHYFNRGEQPFEAEEASDTRKWL